METPLLPQLTVGTRLYSTKECQIMPNISNSGIRERLERLGGIPFSPGIIVEILAIGKNAARIQMYTEDGNKLGPATRWYDLDKFSPDLFDIDHRDPDKETGESISRERATELLEGKGTKRSTDTGETVLEVARAAHKKLTGRDEI